MRAVVQRVKSASVDILEDSTRRRSGQIGRGLMILLAVENADTSADAEFLAAKIASMRIFEDSLGKMNLSIVESGGEVLLVSQFTLFGNMRKGNRPSFNRSAPPSVAIPLYEEFSSKIFSLINKTPQRGVFGAMMDISLVNDGPVTIILDSRNKDI